MLWEPKREEIRFRRTMMGLSMSGLSKKAGLSVSSVLRIESEITKKVSDLRGREIAKALNCNPEDIFIIPSRTGQTAASNKQQKGNHHERIDSVSESGVWQASHSRHWSFEHLPSYKNGE